MRHYVYILFFILLGTSSQAHALDKKYSIALITQRDANDPFWGIAESFMQAACDDLGMRLYIYHAHSNRNNMVQHANDAIAKGVNAIVLPNFKKTIFDVIKLGEQKAVPVFLINADISEQNKELIGAPRERYKYFIGQMLPNDELAGYQLANALFDHALKLKLKTKKDNKIHVVGISGTVTESPSLLRIKGLERAIASRNDVILEQVVFANWEKEEAFEKAIALHKRYPHATVFWSASDLMAKGISESLYTKGFLPGKDVVTGGIDWTIEGLQDVEDGSMVTSIGGHFTEAGFVAVLLYDYFHGIDFAGESGMGVFIQSKMYATKLRTIQDLKQYMTHNNWKHINFRNMSLKLNPSHTKHIFNIPESLYE